MAKTFEKLTAPPEGNNLLLVDSLNLCFRWKHRGDKFFKEEFLRTVQSLAKSYDCSRIILAADWGSSSFRKSIFPEYKGNREELQAQQSPEEYQAFVDFIQEYERTLEFVKDYYPVLRYSKVEADDIAAYLTKKLNVDHIWLISSDKDWDLLVNDKVSRWSYVTRKEITITQWPYEVDPEHYISYKVLIGDKGDNIPGIEGIGPKRAATLIETYGSALDIYDACPINSKYKYVQELNKNYEQILVNLQLMDLLTYCEDAIGPENLEDIDSKVSEYLVNGSN